jgi:CheY-like chemotaxis protein
LTLVKRLIELHGGSVEAHSAGPGRGSEFVLRLPLHKRDEGGGMRDERKTGPSSSLSPHSSSLPKRVLVVDDNRDAADSLAVLVRIDGHDVRVAYDGPAALAAAEAFEPDVVLLDLGMPGMDGYEVCRRLRRMPELAGVRVIAVTGWGQDSDRRRSAEAGFDHHLVKPADPDVVRRLL